MIKWVSKKDWFDAIKARKSEKHLRVIICGEKYDL